MINPFITSGYHSEKYFCNRTAETEFLVRQLLNGNNVALISPRRLGKTGLIQHCFHHRSLKNCYTFLVTFMRLKICRSLYLNLERVYLMA